MKRGQWVDFHQAGSPQNEQSLLFQVLKTLKLSKAPSFVKRGQWVHFHQAGKQQNEQSLLFQVFKAIKPSKAPSFVKRGQWVRFHQAGSSQNEQSLVLMTKAAKNGRWVSYSFLQKLSSFKFCSILEENCGADINNGTFKCKTFVEKCCKKRPFEWVILSYKSQLLSTFSAF